MLKFHILIFLSFYFFSGCGDLEPEIQDKRTVVLNMEFNKRSSSRSSNISASELSLYNTHLILAVPSWEHLNSNYLSYYYSSYNASLMNTEDNRVSMEIPISTELKIFAFLFEGDYNLNDLYSSREVGAYGQSESFSINNQTNNISLGISLQSTGNSSSGGSTGSITPLTDIDGNTYDTVLIGTQNWMAENLKVTKYRDGSSITYYVSSDSGWASLSSGAYGYYDNSTSNLNTYGLLYNWYAANNIREICPEGWHVPSRAEFEILSAYLGGDSVAGAKLKEAGTDHWSSAGGTNESGFTALPGGSRLFSNGAYQYLGTKSYFWSSESSGTNMRILDNNADTFSSVSYVKTMGFSIRCLED